MGGLIDARVKILREAQQNGVVRAYKQRRRTVERMARDGLLRKFGMVEYRLTEAGTAALAAVDALK